MKLFLSALVFASLLYSPSASYAQSVFSTNAAAATPANSAPATASANFSIAEKLSVHGIPNMGKVSEQLLRGAQPDMASLVELKKLGVTTIVDLREESGRIREEERRRAEALGMRFVSIPVGGFANPTPAQVAQFFALLQQTPSEKVFVHCRFGHDRTGVFIAAYRIAVDHWSPNQALSEMNAFGFSHTWHPGMMNYVRDFPNQMQVDPLLKASLLH